MASEALPAALVLKVKADSTVKFRGVLKEVNLAQYTCQIYVSGSEYVVCSFDEEFESLVRFALGSAIEVAGKVTSLRRNGKGFIVREVKMNEMEMLPSADTTSALHSLLGTMPDDSEHQGWSSREDLNSLEDIVNYARQLRGKPPTNKE